MDQLHRLNPVTALLHQLKAHMPEPTPNNPDQVLQAALTQDQQHRQWPLRALMALLHQLKALMLEPTPSNQDQALQAALTLDHPRHQQAALTLDQQHHQ